MILLLLISLWLQDVRLTDDPNFSSLPIPNARGITVNDSTIHVVFADMRTPAGIYYISSNDQGNTWNPSSPIAVNLGICANPAIANKGDTLYVVFQSRISGDWDLYFMFSFDNGVTWSDPVAIVTDPADSYNPSIVCDRTGGVYVAFYDSRDSDLEIYFIKSIDYGTTWEQEVRLTNSAGDSKYPSIAVDSLGYLHMVFFDNRTGNFEVYYKRSIDRGVTWEQEINLSQTPNSISRFTSVATDPLGGVHVVWEDSLFGNLEVLYRRSLDYGSTWDTTIKISNTPSVSDEPIVFADDSFKIHVIWGDYPDYPSTEEIYYIGSRDRGNTWENMQRLTFSAGHKDAHSHVVDLYGNIHIVWMDPRDGNYEVYYKKGIPPYMGIYEKKKYEENIPTVISVNGVLNIPFKNDFILNIFDIQGRLVEEYRINTGPGKIRIGRNLLNSVYFVIIEYNGARYHTKFIKTGGR